MNYLVILIFVLLPFVIVCQHLEIDGDMRISELDLDNSAENLVITLPDGTLAIRPISTLTEYQVLSMSNDTLYLSDGGYVVLPMTNACSHVIGDTFAGGIIFFLDGTGCHGLVASTIDEPGLYQWFPLGNEYTYARSAGLFEGAQNTYKIIYKLGAGNAPAADACVELIQGGYNDWYLPSIDELDLMFVNLHLQGQGGFMSGYYWSSTEGGNLQAWVQKFSDGKQIESSLNTDKFVRAIRSF